MAELSPGDRILQALIREWRRAHGEASFLAGWDLEFLTESLRETLGEHGPEAWLITQAGRELSVLAIVDGGLVVWTLRNVNAPIHGNPPAEDPEIETTMHGPLAGGLYREIHHVHPGNNDFEVEFTHPGFPGGVFRYEGSSHEMRRADDFLGVLRKWAMSAGIPI
jgi:hypothetical protein